MLALAIEPAGDAMKKQTCPGRRVGCAIARAIKDKPHEWKPSPLPTESLYGARITSGRFTVVLIPNERCPCLRAFDSVRLLCDGMDVYVPVVARLCLRKAARRLIQRHAWQCV